MKGKKTKQIHSIVSVVSVANQRADNPMSRRNHPVKIVHGNCSQQAATPGFLLGGRLKSSNNSLHPKVSCEGYNSKDERAGEIWPIRLILKKSQVCPTSSKTSFNLYCVKAEHSTYFTAPSSLAIRSPSSLRMGCIFWRASFSRTFASSRKSVWVPTMRQGTPGQ